MNSLRWLSLVIAFTLLSTPARAWDRKGHRVVAAVAWDHMDASTRTKVVAILRGAAGDSDLLAEDAGSGLTQAQRDRALFLRAATWPDLVRATNQPARRAKYHHSPWHYLNIFWQERGRKPYERRDLKVTGELTARLAERAAVLGDATKPAGERAVALAWFAHLVGDVHQPLHVTARITAFEQEGDAGGNGFCLGKTHPVGAHECTTNLHALWDDILTTPHGTATVDGIATALQQRHGKPLFIGLGNYEGWAREAGEITLLDDQGVALWQLPLPANAGGDAEFRGVVGNAARGAGAVGPRIAVSVR